ncbi:hypothetical protein DFH08DRAFT_885051, partial [Mycena albidolilacea]
MSILEFFFIRFRIVCRIALRIAKLKVTLTATIGLAQATFLAAIQAQLVATSYQDNSTRLKVATNALGFAGLLMGVISACLALLASNILQRHIAIVDKQLTAI